MIAAPDACELTIEERVEKLAEMRRGLDVQELFFCRHAALVAQSTEFANAGYATPLQWIRKEARMESGAAADRVCVGEQMDSLEDSVQAMLAGEIGFAHLVVIARTAERLRSSPSSRGFEEAKVLEHARLEDNLTSFRTFCLKYSHAMDPEGFVNEEVEEAAARKLEITGTGTGMVFIKGMLDPAGGAALRTAIEPLARKAGKGDDRDRARRVADALVEIATRALDSGTLPAQGGQRPHLLVNSTLETLLGAAGSPAADMEFSLPISGEHVKRIACDCSVTRILVDPQSAVIDVGRAKRVVHPALRKALAARDRQCVWPGCGGAASFAEAHHLVHWADGGRTELGNLALLCYRHHWMVHEGRWQLIRSDDGRVLAISPRDFQQPAPRGPD